MLLFMVFMLIVLIFMIFFMMSMKIELDIEGLSSYECGFDPMSSTRYMFSYRFFLITILFLIFDVEIALMLAIPFVLNYIYSLFIFIMFIFILLLGLLYEYLFGSLEWLV